MGPIVTRVLPWSDHDRVQLNWDAGRELFFQHPITFHADGGVG